MSEVRLIDANALKEELAKNITVWTFNVSYDGILAEIIDNAPTVEQKYYERVIAQINPVIEARPQGEWEEYACSDAHGCSLCGYMDSLYFEHHYCPNCGAQMQKGGAE